MRQLLDNTGSAHTFTRPSLPQGQSSHHIHFANGALKPYSNRNSEEFPPGTQTPNAIRAAASARARRRIKRAGNYVVRRCREERIAKEKVLSAMRYSINMKKKDASRQCRKTEDSMFKNILRVLGDLDRELQGIVDRVKEIEPERKTHVNEEGMGLTRGMPLSYLPLQGGHSRRNSATRAGSSKPGAIHKEYGPTPPPQESKSRTSTMPVIGSLKQRASEVLNSSWPLSHRTNFATEHRNANLELPAIQITPSRNGHARNSTVPGISPLTAEPESPDLVIRPGRFDRLMRYLLHKYPTSWTAKRIKSMNWLRVREKAFELRKQRDVQWNRMHAAQLAMLSRRIEDQDEHIEMLDEHMTQQFRLVSSAILTYEGK